MNDIFLFPWFIIHYFGRIILDFLYFRTHTASMIKDWHSNLKMYSINFFHKNVFFDTTSLLLYYKTK